MNTRSLANSKGEQYAFVAVGHLNVGLQLSPTSICTLPAFITLVQAGTSRIEQLHGTAHPGARGPHRPTCDGACSAPHCAHVVSASAACVQPHAAALALARTLTSSHPLFLICPAFSPVTPDTLRRCQTATMPWLLCNPHQSIKPVVPHLVACHFTICTRLCAALVR